jgi:hypothetical protein
MTPKKLPTSADVLNIFNKKIKMTPKAKLKSKSKSFLEIKLPEHRNEYQNNIELIKLSDAISILEEALRLQREACAKTFNIQNNAKAQIALIKNAPQPELD